MNDSQDDAAEKSRSTNSDTEILAARIAIDLFTDGEGRIAQRLSLRKDGRHIGGWSLAAVESRIRKHLRGEL